MSESRLYPQERRTAAVLAAVYTFRMLGLFMIMPVIALHAERLPDATPLLIGLAIGIYGLSQALLQIPFGVISDRLGRKPVIIAGLLLFALGSVVAALSTTMVGIILGRAIQGSGAIAAVVMALAADASRESQRTKIMAVIGISIGGSFIISLVLGPLLYIYIDLSGIFWLVAGLALLGIALIHYGVPSVAMAPKSQENKLALSYRIALLLKNAQLMRLNLGIMVLHTLMTAGFLAIPYLLRDYLGVASEQHWLAYLAVLVASLILLIPMVIAADRLQKPKSFIVGAIVALVLVEAGLAGFIHKPMVIWGLLIAFFVAFNLLEASLPALLSKMVPQSNRGTAMGIYSSCQFFGAFLGGLLGGWLLGLYGLAAVFVFGSVISLVWLMLAARGNDD